jgi:transcriptional regulator with XRE-family HTH domain
MFPAVCRVGTYTITPTTDSIADQVRAMRNARNLSQGELADLIGLSRTSVTNMEAGNQPVSTVMLARIAQVLKFELTLTFTPL